ncbi:MAG: PAS domain-containing protein [Casimicrobiaceae bacterium]
MIGLRARLLFPLGVFVLLWGAYTLAAGEGGRVTPAVLLGLLALLLGVMATNTEFFVMRPLRRLLQAAQDLTQDRYSGAPINAPPGALRELATGINRLRDRMQSYETRLADEKTRRQVLEQSVRELEDRYALTVERANDGIWEWNLENGEVDYSLRWKGLLGLSDARIGRIEDWQGMLHPEERADVILSLDNHLAGLTQHFDKEYRLRHGDGHFRWIHSRGTAIRHAAGKPYRMVVMDNDIHERKTIEETLIQAAEGLSSVTGQDFYHALMKSLSSILGTRDNLVCYCIGDPPTKAHTLAYYSNGKFFENFEYDLAGTSCGAVIDRGEIVYAPTGVCDVWPLEKEFDRDSYIGVPMFDSAGKIIGHFACMDGKPMKQDLPHLALFKIFSVRAAAEVERMLLKQKLDAE